MKGAVDPDCPVVKAYRAELWDDPMTRASGVGDEIQAYWDESHLYDCSRCQEHAAANVSP